MDNCDHVVLYAGIDVQYAQIGICVTVAATDLTVVGWSRARSDA